MPTCCLPARVSDNPSIRGGTPTVTSKGEIAKLPFRTRRDDTTAAVRQIVLSGALPSGARLRDTDLAATLGVSRPTVREAVRQLVYEGILVEEPYRGLVVAGFDDAALIDLADVRVAIETLAAERLARAADPDVGRQLEAQLRLIDSARDNSDADAVNEAHFGFHGLVHVLSGVPILAQMWDLIEGRTRLALRIDLDVRPDFERISVDHRAMLEAIRSRDEKTIDKFIANHIRGGAREVVEHRHGRALEPDTPKRPRGSRRS